MSVQKFYFFILKSIRAILNTPRSRIGKKKFNYFSLMKGLKRKINKGVDGDEILIKIGGDGVSSDFKSVSYEIRPILCRVSNCKDVHC